jgi:hypothetical protein
MHKIVLSLLKSHQDDLLKELQATREQAEVFRKINKGDLVYAEHLYIRVSKDGVGSWIESYFPALLQYTTWGYCEGGFALDFNLIATQDPEPFEPKYQPEYSGIDVQIRCPKYFEAKKIKVVPHNDLLLYIGYPYKTKLWDILLKGPRHVNKIT